MEFRTRTSSSCLGVYGDGRAGTDSMFQFWQPVLTLRVFGLKKHFLSGYNAYGTLQRFGFASMDLVEKEVMPWPA